MESTIKIDELNSTNLDKTLSFAKGEAPRAVDADKLRNTLGIKNYSDIDFYGETSLLGKGGVGIVLKGRDYNLGREVAVKILNPLVRDQPGALRRFIREARATAQVEHPNIVAVHEMGVHPEWGLYFTMKKLDGVDLSKILSALKNSDTAICAKYSLSHLLHIFTDVCNGIFYITVPLNILPPALMNLIMLTNF